MEGMEEELKKMRWGCGVIRRGKGVAVNVHPDKLHM